MLEIQKELTERAVQLYLKVAVSVRGRDRRYWYNKIIKFVAKYNKKHGKGPKLYEIAEKIGFVGVSKYLQFLTSSAQLSKTREGRNVRYSVVKQ